MMPLSAAGKFWLGYAALLAVSLFCLGAHL